MFKVFYPSYYMDSTYDIDFEALFDKGYRGVMFDIDNTLVEHDEPATDRAIELFKRLRDIGFKTCLISNNKEYRILPLATLLETDYVYKALKPKKYGYLKGMEKMNTDVDNTLFVGDQLFTDIWGANRVGITSILVKPIAKHEEIQIVLKRLLEKPVLHAYNRQVVRRNRK